MSQVLDEVKTSKIKTPANVVRDPILQGDGCNRHFLMGDLGNFLAVSDDIYHRYCFAEPFTRALEEIQIRQQTLQEEVQRLLLIVEKWMECQEGKIDADRTKLLPQPLCSSAGKVRFQFIVIPLEGQAEFLEKELVLLDDTFLKDSTFQIVRLDSVLM